VESLANGIPLITTSHWANGLETGIDHAFLVADDGYSFLNSILNLINNERLRKNLSLNAVKLVRTTFSEVYVL